MKKFLVVVIVAVGMVSNLYASDDQFGDDRARLENVCPELVSSYDSCAQNVYCTIKVQQKCWIKITHVPH